jgi:hypothetical protein
MTWLPWTRLRSIRAALFAAVAAGALGVGALALFAPAGCGGSDCKVICGPGQAYIGSADGKTAIPLAGYEFSGPACPPNYGKTCIPPQSGYGCAYFTVTGLGPGACDVGVVFSDRPAEIIHLEFGASKTCCPGFPVVGDSTFIVPANPDAGITGNLSGADAITIVVDGGASDATDDAADGGVTDGGVTDDGGATD